MVDEAELGPGAVEVVAFSVGAEVAVAFEEVGEEAGAALHGDDSSGVGHGFPFGGVERASGGFGEPLDDGVEAVEVEVDFGEVGLVFGGGVAGGADEVSDIEEDGAGHDGVEVDDGEAFEGLGAEEDVVDFGVVVSDAGGLGVLGEDGHEFGGEFLVGEDEFGFGSAELGAAGDGVGEGFLEPSDAFGSVVEIGKGDVEVVVGEVGEVLEELSEGYGGGVGDVGAGDDVEDGAVFDEVVGSPEMAVFVLVEGVAVVVVYELEESSVAGSFVGEVFDDPADIFHHARWVGEDVGVDELVDVSALGVSGADGADVGAVDMATLNLFTVKESSSGEEVWGHRAEEGHNAQTFGRYLTGGGGWYGRSTSYGLGLADFGRGWNF